MLSFFQAIVMFFHYLNLEKTFNVTMYEMTI